MTTLNQEFNNEFDILYNNIASNQAPGLDIYEKSVFLTNAQEEVVLSIYSNTEASNLETYERTEEMRRYLDSLIETKEISFEYGYYVENTDIFYTDKEHTDEIVPSNGHYYIDKPTRRQYIWIEEGDDPSYYHYELQIPISSESYITSLPEDLWFITYEAVQLVPSDNICLSKKELDVVPVTQDAFHNIKNNPFRGAANNRVLRLDFKENKVELISKNDIGTYKVRYIKKLKPIILDSLGNSLSIDGEHNESECTLNRTLHKIIINRAVRLAIASMAQSIQQ